MVIVYQVRKRKGREELQIADSDRRLWLCHMPLPGSSVKPAEPAKSLVVGLGRREAQAREPAQRPVVGLGSREAQAALSSLHSAVRACRMRCRAAAWS